MQAFGDTGMLAHSDGDLWLMQVFGDMSMLAHSICDLMADAGIWRHGDAGAQQL